MITQGTDGLSRGVWLTSLQALMSEQRLLQAIFDPLPFDLTLVWEYIAMIPGAWRQWRHQQWNQVWMAHNNFNQLNVCLPPPEIAIQALSFTLETWWERPHSTSALFFIPRVVPSFWWGLSRYLQELPPICPQDQFMSRPPILPIPITVLYLAPHSPTLSVKPRMDSPQNYRQCVATLATG
mmetsp:Transcript_3571/g.5532  ORF Transcript_3571/g.5532 Transcript_3571/m.5532 type:complete len:181 (-) Transcript_3571:842-1384(-)